jgi:hypothetical protein
VREIKNFGDAVAVLGVIWQAFISSLPTLTALLLFAYALMRAVNEFPSFYATVRRWFKK